MAINPEWVTLPLNERAALEANAHTEQADRLAEFINKRVDAINQPSTNDSFNRVVVEALKQPDIDSFLLATKDNSPYDEKTLTSIYVDATEGMKNNKELAKSKQLFSDSTIDNTFGAETANALLSAGGRVPVIGGNVANLGLEGVKSLQKVGLTSDDWNTYQGIAAKEYAYKDAADALATEQDPNKQKILQERMAKNSPDTYTAEQKAMFDKEITQDVSVSPGGTADLIIGGQDSIAVSKIDKIKGIEEVTRGQEAIRDYSKAIDSLVNRTKVEDMVADTKRNFNNSEGIIEAIAVAGEAIVNNPGAIFQSAVQSVPDIALAATSFGTSIAANFQEKTMEARDIYKQTYGKDATGDADNQLMATAFLAGLVDSGADRFLIKGFKPGTSPAALVADSKILGDGFTKAATTQFLKITQAGAAGTVTEFGAEAGGEALTQLAGKQGGADIDWAQSFAEGVIGAGSGGAIATGASVLTSSKEVVTDTAQKMAGRVKAKEDKDISSLVSNPATMDIPGASRLMTSIISDPDATPEQKVKAVSDMEKAFDLRSIMEIASKHLQLKASSEEGITEADGKKLTILESRLKDLNDVSEIVKIAKDSIQGISIEKSIDVLTSPEINEDGTKPDADISRMAINKVLSDALDVNTQFTTEHAKNILDNRTDLTEDQRMNLRTFMEVNSKMDALQAAAESGKKTTGQVREDVFNGGKGFIGAKTYVSAILGSIKHKQDKIAESLFSELETFAVRHTAKAHALNLINDSFIKGHGMSAELQNTVMQAAVPGIKFKPFTRAQPYVNNVMEESAVLNEVTAAMRQRLDVLKETNTASVPVSTVAKSQTEATVDTQPQAEPVQQPTEVDSTNRASVPGGNTQPVSGTDTTLDELLSLSEDEAIARINPSGVNTNTEDEVKLTDETAPDYEQDSTQITEVDGVRIVKTKSGNVHAVDKNNNVVSSIGLQDGVTVVQNRDTAPRGIGTQVIKEFIRRNPNAKAGSFTKGGEKAYRRAIRELQAEKQTQPSKREAVSPERETEVVTGTVTDEVLNEGVATEQAEGGIDTWDSLMQEREDMVQDEVAGINEIGVEIEASLNALDDLANMDVNPLSRTRLAAITRRFGKDTVEAFTEITRKILQAAKDPDLLRNLTNNEKYPNLLAKYLRVKPSVRDTPIIAIPGFISRLGDMAVRSDLVAKALTRDYKSISGSEDLVLTKLVAFAKDFHAAIDSSIEFEPDFGLRSPINYFSLAEKNADGSSTIKSEVKDAMAVASFNWIAQSAADSLSKTDKQIGKTLGLELDEGTPINGEVYRTVGESGVPYQDEVLNIGNEVIKLLGLQLNPEAGKDLHHTFMTELAMSIGNAAVNSMFNMLDTAGNPIVNMVEISADDMNVAYELVTEQVSLTTARSNVNARTRERRQFKEATRTIQVAYTKDSKAGVRKPNDHIQGEIIGPVQAAGSFLQDVFGTLKPTKFPTFNPVVIKPETDVTLKRTEQKAAEEGREALNKLNSTPNYWKNWFVRMSGDLTQEKIAELFGFIPDVESGTHVDKVESIKSANNLKMLEVSRLFAFHDQFTNHKKFADTAYGTPFYLSYEQNRTARVQTQQNVMNAQSNKDTRHTMYKGDWKQSYSTDPAENPQAALAWELAVAQALGIAIDKQFPVESQEQLAQLLKNPVLQAAIEAASNINDSTESVTTEQWTLIENALDLPMIGRSAASLDGIFALGARMHAQETGKATFDSDIGIEYDGVTDGPMRVLLQYASVDKTWATQLAAGGIYINSGISDTVTGAREGILDRYQQTIVTAESMWNDKDKKTSSVKIGKQWVNLILQKVDKKTGKVTDVTKGLLNQLYGPMVNHKDDGSFSISKTMRNIAKVIVTPMGYQASAIASQNAFGNSIQDRLTTLFANKHKLQIGEINIDSIEGQKIEIDYRTTVDALNKLAPGFIQEVYGELDSVEWLKTKINMDKEFPFAAWIPKDPDDRNAGVYEGTVMMTVPEFLGRTYGKTLTDAVQKISESSTELRAQTVAVTNMAVAVFEATRDALVEKVLAAKGDAKGAAAVLTLAEAEAIQNQLKAIHPELANALTSDLGEGVSILKTKGTALQTRKVSTKLKPTKQNTGKTSSVSTPTSNIKSPGVSAVPVQILADDASNLIRGTLRSTDQEVLHDASINSPVHAIENMKHWNRVMFENALSHSVPVATANMITRVLHESEQLIEGGVRITEALAKKYNLTEWFDNNKGELDTVPAYRMEELFKSYMQSAQAQFDERKKALTTGLVTVNHYAADGADVTFKNGTEINFDNMTQEEINTVFDEAFADVAAVVNDAPQSSDDVDVDTANTTTGTTSVTGNFPISGALEKAFDKHNGVLSVKQALNTVEAGTDEGALVATQAILKKLANQVSPDLTIISYDPAQVYAGDLAWLNDATEVRELIENSLGIHVPANNTKAGGANKPVILLRDTKDDEATGISQETLVHELLHSVFDKHISNPDSVIHQELIKLMDAVQKQLDAYTDPKILSWVKENTDKASGKLFGLTNVREFLAWGFSNQQFQNLLKRTEYSEALPNELRVTKVAAWTRFKNIVIKAVFGTDVKNPRIDNAMGALIEIAAGIGYNNAPNASEEISQQQTNHGHRHDISRANSMDLFNRMKHMGHSKASVSHSNTLANVLESIVNVAMTPLQVVITGNQVGESFGDLTAADRLEIYSASRKDTSVQGLPNQIGFNKSVQESYVYGLLQAVLDEGLTATTVYSNAANKLFNVAKEKLTYLDFMEDPASQDPLEIEFAKRRYDSVFDVSSHAANTYSDTSSGLTFEMHRSNYLRNFLALASTNEQFANALRNVSIPVSTKPVTLLDKIIGLVTDVFNFILNKTTGVNTRDNVKVNLDRLTARLVTKHLEEQSKLEKVLDGTLNYTSAALGYAAKVLRQGIVKIGASNAVQNSQFKAVRTAGTIAKLVGSDRSEFLFKSVDQLFSQLSQGKQSMLGEIGNELKGTTKDTTKVHTLLRVANHVLDRGRKQVIETTKKMLLSSFHRELSKQEKVGLTKFLLRTDAISLNALGYTQDQLANLIDRPTYRAQEIANLEGKISGFVTDAKLRDYYLNMAEELGTTMVNGFSSDANMVPNAYAIANVWKMQTVQRPDDATVAAVMPLIDGLASIHAIQRTAAKAKYSGVANLIREEHTRNDANGDRDNNGITFMLRTHAQLQEKALKENFGGNPALMRKGHMPSITNPYLDVQVGYKSDAAIAAKRGYNEVYELENDANHHMAPQRAMFLSKAGGLAQFTRMAFSTTQNKTIGFKISDPGDIAILTATAIQQEARLTNGRVSPLYSRNPVHAQAIFNEDGDVVGYRYVMAESTKDNLLERDDDFSEVLPKHAGNVYDKSVTKPHNELVVETLKEQYDIDVAAGKAGNYIRLSLKSDDPELAELYKLLPDATREHIKKVFGTDSIPVRAEFLRVVFGFRNVTITDLWTKETDNGFFGDLVKNSFETISAGNGMLVASHFERALKDIVRVAKTNLVVRTGVITAANFISNTYDLLINGLSLREAASWQADGYKYGIQYIKLTSRIAEINMLLEADHNPSHRKKLESEKAQLMQLQATNPAAKLIEAGLLQTIVLEVNQDIDPFSMTSRWAKRLEEKTSKLPQGVQDVGKFVLMTRDSQSFEVMNRLVQFGDFAARYALYKKITTRKDKPMNHVDAIQKVITHFVNYDLPTHRMIQYGNDMGFIWFSRYWLRIQKVILTNFAENPGRVLTGMMLQGMLGVDISDTHDSSVISTGVLHPFGGFDRIASGLIANPVIPGM